MQPFTELQTMVEFELMTAEAFILKPIFTICIVQILGPTLPNSMLMSFSCSTIPQEAIKFIAQHLNRITAANDLLPASPVLSHFLARSKPSIDLHTYLARILQFAPCGTECLIAAMVYLDRVQQVSQQVDTNHEFPLVINSWNVHRMVVISIMIAVKFMSDVFFTNVHVASIQSLI